MRKNLNIIFEDSHILVVDKPAGLVVNRASTVKGPTLQDKLFDYFKATLPKGSDPNVGGRAGIVHRLDRETSGLLLVAKTQKAFDFLQEQFGMREVQKEYIALVHGFVKENRGSILADIGRVGKFGKFGVVKAGRESATDFEVIDRYQFKDQIFNPLLSLRGEQRRSNLDSGKTQKIDRFAEFTLSGANVLAMTGSALTKSRINYLRSHAREYSLLRLYPKTGRTHQVRVHLKSIGHPVVSDKIYAPNKLLKFDLGWCPRLFLHAAEIEFKHPQTKRFLQFTSDLPKDLKNAILNLSRTTNV